LVAVAGSLHWGFPFIGWAMASELIAAMAVTKEERSTKWFEEE
jgi:hypothetical protein